MGESPPKRSTGAETAASGKGPRLGQREDILLRAQKAALALNPKPAFGFRSAANPELLPKAKPWAVREHFVVPSIRGREVARAQRSGVRRCENALNPLDFGNSLLGVHSVPIRHSVVIVRRCGICMSKKTDSVGIAIAQDELRAGRDDAVYLFLSQHPSTTNSPATKSTPKMTLLY